MKKILSFIAILSMLLPLTVDAKIIQAGDTPYGLWGPAWPEQMQINFGHSNPYRLPVGVDVQLDGEETLGARTAVSYLQRSGTELSPRIDGDTLAIDITGDVTGDITGDVNATNVTSTNLNVDNIYNTNLLSIVTATSTEVLENGSFENLNTESYYTPDTFEVFDLFTEAVNPDLFERSTDSYAGTYAFLTKFANDVGGGTYVGNGIFYDDFFTNDETVQFTTYAKIESGSPMVCVLYEYVNDEDDDVVWDSDTDTWVVVEDDGALDYLMCQSATAGYTKLTFDEATAPSSGVNEGDIFVVPIGGSANDELLLDDMEMLFDSSNVLTNGDFEDWTQEQGLSQSDPAEDWTFYPNEEGAIAIVTTSAQVGSYAIGLQSSGDASTDAMSYLVQQYDGTATDELELSLYNKCEDNYYDNGDFYFFPMVILANATSSPTQYWNHTTSAWVTTSTPIVDIAYNEGYGDNSPYNDYFFALSTTTDWAEFSTTTTVPTNGQLAVLLLNGAQGYSTDDQAKYYFDDVSLLLPLDDTEVSIDEPYSLIKVNSTANSSILTLDTDLLGYCSESQTFFMTIKDQGGNSNTNNIVIDTEGSELIDGGATTTISTDYDWRELYCDGTDFFITSQK